MLEAAFWGFIASGALLIGAAIGIWANLPRRVVALVMGFGGGALISAVSFDLTAEAFALGGTAPTAMGLAAGALAFFVGDLLLERAAARGGGTNRKSGGGGLTIVLGALLDGLPESVVLGASLLGGAGVSTSFLAAVFASNLPEGLGAARDLREEGRSPAWIMGLWLAVVIACTLAAGLGYGVLGDMAPGPASLVQAFAAGAILAMLADSLMPEAFEHGGIGVGLATVLGFSFAFFLSAAPG